MEMDFVGPFELEYGWMVDFSRIIVNIWDMEHAIMWKNAQ